MCLECFRYNLFLGEAGLGFLKGKLFESTNCGHEIMMEKAFFKRVVFYKKNTRNIVLKNRIIFLLYHYCFPVGPVYCNQCINIKTIRVQ